MKAYLVQLLLILFIAGGVIASPPVSRQATVLDATSPTDLLLDATGIYESDKRTQWGKRRDTRRFGVQNALEDARKAAIYVLLYTSSDPILNSDEEKKAFKAIESDFFESISRYITYEADSVKSKVMIANDTGVKVTVQLKVNREAILDDLAARGILIEQTALLDALGNPFIMVLPQTRTDQTSPLDLLESDRAISHAANVIQGLLTNRQYDVVIPDQQLFLNNLDNQARTLEAISSDLAYQLALSIGSDIYLDFDIIETEEAYGTTKIAAQVRAFETTTARLLGAETGYSEARQGEVFVSIEEALLLAINTVMARVNAYWKADNASGVQYKIIATLPNTTDARMIETIQDNFLDSLDAIAVKTKSLAITDTTIDMIIWVDSTLSSRQLWRAIRDRFRDLSPDQQISLVNQNRKRVSIQIE